MLTQTAFQPLYGKISDLVGRKVSSVSVSRPSLIRPQNVLYASMAIFALGSLLCGAAEVAIHPDSHVLFSDLWNGRISLGLS